MVVIGYFAGYVEPVKWRRSSVGSDTSNPELCQKSSSYLELSGAPPANKQVSDHDFPENKSIYKGWHVFG